MPTETLCPALFLVAMNAVLSASTGPSDEQHAKFKEFQIRNTKARLEFGRKILGDITTTVGGHTPGTRMGLEP